MRVVLRTPTEKVAEYELAGLDGRASDEQILAAAAEVKPIRVGEVEVVGRTYVYARGLDVLAEQGKRLEQAEARLDGEKAAARVLARQFFDEGMSKQAIVAALGITRPTLDAWLGEGYRRRRRGGG
jgi:hypothetical protein